MEYKQENIENIIDEPKENKLFGFIKLYNSFKKWEWYSDNNMVRLYLHILLSVNWKPKKWQGIIIKRGQLATSYSSLSEQTNLSLQNVRTCLGRLKSTGEITIKVTNKYQLVTVVNYEEYQKKDDELTSKLTSKLTINQQSTNNQLTTTKEYKDIKDILLSKIKISDVDDNLKPYYKIAIGFWKLFIKNLKERNASTKTQDNAKYLNYVTPIRLMIESDDYSTEQLRQAYNYLNSNNGEFWKKNILSTSKLRVQMDKLMMEINKPKKFNNNDGKL